jgi:hypothetical protein
MFEYFTIRECDVLWSLEMCRYFEEIYCLQLQNRKVRISSVTLSSNSTCIEKQARASCSVPRYILIEVQRVLKVRNRQRKGGHKIKNKASL